ncbi:MAG: 3-deoxy-D-manno-octulosonic acid transferase [Acinetobacter sp.]|nr:3-deoxy-D-manno-octulosonic acid transferase [Acinetobacter sp.]MBP8206637.1 3-deoxy-D-manno-octulosonic acid transferase [Acinetobacter sp.]
MATPFWYNAALAIVKPLYRWKIKKRAQSAEAYQQECLERFGPFQAVKNTQTIWFHVVSVGETNAAQPLIEHYLQLGHPVLVTNTTKTGQARAKSLFLKAPHENLFQAVYLPADQKSLVAQFFEKYQPKMLVLVETELWPNLIAQAKKINIPAILVNARLSEKSANGYAKVKSLTQPMLHGLTQLLAQDQASLQRFQALGMPTELSQVVGSIKFDIHAPQSFVDQAEQLKDEWSLHHRKVITLASTHAPEEQKLIKALSEHLIEDPELLIIVVPRHPERFAEVYQVTQDLNLNTKRRSLGQLITSDTQVYLADSMGEMWLWYALSNACFVGGSLNEPGGGHNILEPISLNVPTVIGPNYFNFQTIVNEFVEAYAVAVGDDAEQVASMLLDFAENESLAKQMAMNAQVIMQKNAGSLAKHIQVLDQYL